ncbi:ABC transporter permease [Kutzneria buriramensis]|uniref:Uncharacterized protein n=1 Tax=Kutzneria buriramensis TaxID=1045776 RepID=A0A3E0IA12_9PSEU|nr:ABC transporter permease [Kutzneria buriramensis]REH55441.1 hypothetical protein BCF44_101462 [Kutzneria buriramensis]
MSSAFPRPVDELVPAVRDWATELGQLPSRNKIKQRFRIGADKANTVLAALAETGFDPTAPTEPATPPERPLHLVPDPTGTDAGSEPDTDDEPAEPASETSADPDIDRQLEESPADNPTEVTPQVSTDADPGTPPTVPPAEPAHKVRRWPLLLLAVGAFVAIWSGWVGLGEMTGFGLVHPLPGIADGLTLNSAITLPIGVETYAAYAMRVWLARVGSRRAQRFARTSAIGSLVLGGLGQVAYHLMSAGGVTHAPWPITTFVACLPVVVLGFGAALAHLQHSTEQ